MELYTRRQLVLLLGLLGAALAGLGVAQWRARHPELVDRLEQWDRAARADRPATGRARLADDDPGTARDLAEPRRRAIGPDPGSREGSATGAVADPAASGAQARRLKPASAGTRDVSRAARDPARPTPREGPRPRPVKLPSAPSGEPPPGPLDLNRAGPEELVRLPGVGPALAARIVAAREAAGRFASVDDLERVRGLGRAKIERLRPLVVAGE
jgi:competence ComEA-like helix-hairpin-helix protein